MFGHTRAISVSLSILLSVPWLAGAKTTQTFKELRFDVGPALKEGKLLLHGAAAKQQLLITGATESGALYDLTREVRYQVSPAGLARLQHAGHGRAA